jgi:regulator-associated protein of mTOR
VRAAAVFALGTFMNSVGERTEHANSLDHSIALNLLNSVSDDASPLIRRELVVALNIVVKVFEANFVTVCRIAMEEENAKHGGGGANSYATIGPETSATHLATGGLRRVLSAATSRDPNKITPSVSSPSLDRLGTASMGGALNRSSSSLLSLSSFNINSVYTKVWTCLVFLTRDPDPDTASMSSTLVSYLKVKAKEKERTSRIPSILETASSVPSSPAKPSFLIGHSPPPVPPTNIHQDRLSERREASRRSPAAVAAAVAAAAAASSSAREPLQSAPAGAQAPLHHSLPSQPRPPSASTTSSPSTTQTAADLKALKLETHFLPWSSRYFTKQLMKYESKTGDDHESLTHWSKEWLYERNLEVRSCSEQQRFLLKTRLCKLDELETTFKTSFVPHMVLFHPYNPQVAVAGARTIEVRALDSSSSLCRIDLKDSRHGGKASFTSLQYVNAHQQALLLTGSDDGCIRVYRDDANSRLDDGTYNVKMVTAWQAMRASVSRRKMCMAWEQKEMLIAVGGADGRTVHIWDAAQERKRADLGTSAEDAATSFVSCLSFSPTNPFLLGAGFGDGCTRLYDTRVDRKQNSVLQFWEHDRHEKVIAMQLQDSGGYVGHMVSGSTDGKIKVVDPKKGGDTARSIDLKTPVVGLTIHRRAFAVAAWTSSQYVVVHSLLGEGPQLNVIRHHEGMLGGYKMGAAGCHAFHPHLLKLATGTSDGTVSIYNLRKSL